jgi:hypothetical protein
MRGGDRVMGGMREGGSGTVDLAAAGFMVGPTRVLDRRRFDLLFAGSEPSPLLAAVDGAWLSADELPPTSRPVRRSTRGWCERVAS